LGFNPRSPKAKYKSPRPIATSRIFGTGSQEGIKIQRHKDKPPRPTATLQEGNKHTNTQIHKYTKTQRHKYANTQIHKYTNTQIHKYTNTQIHKYTNSPRQNLPKNTYFHILKIKSKMNKKTNSILKAAIIISILFLGTQAIAQTKSVTKPANTPAKTEAAVPVKMVSLDLSSTGINATIMVPEGVAIIKDEYNILIGDGKKIQIQIEEFKEPFSNRVEYVRTNKIRNFVKFVQIDANSFIAIMNPFGSMQEFDFAYLADINGTKYMLRDRGHEWHDNIKIIEQMLAIARTMKAK
jgi:hypothetical protein